MFRFPLQSHSILANQLVGGYRGKYLFTNDINFPFIIFPVVVKSNRKAKNRNWSNQKANSALKTKTGNK